MPLVCSPVVVDFFDKNYEKLVFDKDKPQKISSLLRPDSSLIKENLHSILDKEGEYADFLYAIEESICHEYLNNNKISDKKIVTFLKRFSSNLDAKIDFFKSNFEIYLYENIIEALNEKEISKHELGLCIKYILWCIDNRFWLNDSQAYVKWLAHSTGVMNLNEAKNYQNKVKSFCRRAGVPEQEIKAILTNNFDKIKVPDKETTKDNCRFFAVDDAKKLDFVLEKFEEDPTIGEQYYNYLMEEKDYDGAEKLCKSLLEMLPDFPPIEILLGIVYKEKKKNLMAKHYFDKSLKSLSEVPEDFPDKKIMVKQLADLIKEVDSS